MDEMRSRARSDWAWDEEGNAYRRKKADASRDDAARAVKHGAQVGVLRDWGYGTIEWRAVPAVCQKLDPARTLIDELGDEVASSSPEHSEVLRSVWADAKTQNTVVLIEAVF